MYKLAIVLLLSFFTGHPDLENIITSSKWKVESVKLYNGKTFPKSTDKPLTSDTSPPICGQIISFNKDYTCSVGKYKGQGMWSQLDQFKWSVDNSGNLFLESYPKGSTIRVTLNVESVNENEIVFYTNPAIGIETGQFAITVYKLRNDKS